jgi:hypothetical protein
MYSNKDQNKSSNIPWNGSKEESNYKPLPNNTTSVPQEFNMNSEMMQDDTCSEKLTETNPCQGHNKEDAAFSQASLQQQVYNLKNTKP